MTQRREGLVPASGARSGTWCRWRAVSVLVQRGPVLVGKKFDAKK